MTVRIVHIIVGLDVGGAELMLKRLALSFQEHPRYEHCVISLTSIGTVGEQLRNAGIEVRSLGMSSFAALPVTIWRLFLLIRSLRPAVVQTWMYHADFLGGWVGRFLGCKVVWGIRSTGIPQRWDSLTWWLVRFNAICSHFLPHNIICCAESAKQAHTAIGFASRKMVVIPNGYDFSDFSFNSADRELVRKRLGFKPSDIVIGVVGRFDALKDFQNFIVAAKFTALECPEVKFLMVGRGLESGNLILREWIAAEGLDEKFSLVGQQAHIPSYLSAMDLFCLSSKMEAFPNVVVEAMAIGLPCVVTNAGDAAAIVGEWGWVIPVKNPIALSRGLVQACLLSASERLSVGEKGAQQVRAKYDIDTIRRQYESLYGELAKFLQQ